MKAMGKEANASTAKAQLADEALEADLSAAVEVAATLRVEAMSLNKLKDK